MTERAKRFWLNTATLTGAGLLMRTVAVGFNAFLTARVGAEGMGLFTLVMSVYGFAVTLATSGAQLAVTRLLAEALGRGEYGEARTVLRHAAFYALSFGGGTALLLFFGAPFIGGTLLGDVRTVFSLRLLAVSLVPIALSSVCGGYFVAMRRVSRNAAVQIFEQALRILLTVWGLLYVLPEGMEYACIALVGGAALSEFCSFFVLFFLFLLDRRRLGRRGGRVSGVGRRFLGTALPLAVSSYVRAGLSTTEHLLIPRCLSLGTADRSTALASYGVLHGMSLPLLLYPMAPLSAGGGLLVTEFAESHSRGEMRELGRLALRVLRMTVFYSLGATLLLYRFAPELGRVVYRTAEAGVYLGALAFVVPVMYLDHVTDWMLKGLGEQTWCMVVNSLDSLLAILLIRLLLPRWGALGYVGVIVLTELFNFSLSFGRLLKRLRFGRRWLSSFLPTVLAASAALWMSRRLLVCPSEAATAGSLVLSMLFVLSCYIALCLFFSFFSRHKAEYRKNPLTEGER